MPEKLTTSRISTALITVAATTDSGATVFSAGTPCTVRIVGENSHDAVKLEVSCSADGNRIRFQTGLGDLRAWEAGTTQPKDHLTSFTVDQQGKPTCFATFHPSPVDFSLESAAGASAPAPSLVTSDFARSYRFVLPARGVIVGMPWDVCKERVDVSLGINVQFEQTAADYKFDPNGPCGCGE